MKKLIILTMILVSLYKVQYAQNSYHSYTIPTEQLTVDGNSLNAKPGDTIWLEAGAKRYLKLINFHGDSCRNIIFLNQGGSVVVKNMDGPFGIKISNSSFFRFSGTGIDSIHYGIKVSGTKHGCNGIIVEGRSTNFELDHLEVSNTGFAGIMTKSEPRCDLSCNLGNFIQYNTILHDNYIHDTGGEGFYIGHSFYNGWHTMCNGHADTLFPHLLIGVKIYNNIVEHTHWDGIQLGCGFKDCEIYGNKVTNYGTDAINTQNNGIQMSGSAGKCYNNYIANGTGNGILIFGLGDNYVYNNVIINAGLNYYPTEKNKKVDGIYCDDRYTIPSYSYYFFNNTIISPKTDGIRFVCNKSDSNRFYNNIIVNPGSLGSYSSYSSENSFINFASKDKGIQSNNYFSPNTKNLDFVDANNNNFRLLSTSVAIDKGKNLSSYGIIFDFDKHSRPSGGNFDIGAFEYQIK
ncbi:MAG: right-handed parallel beta-helix repeat-containing protein [Bacteroidales bacterium]